MRADYILGRKSNKKTPHEIEEFFCGQGIRINFIFL